PPAGGGDHAARRPGLDRDAGRRPEPGRGSRPDRPRRGGRPSRPAQSPGTGRTPRTRARSGRAGPQGMTQARARWGRWLHDYPLTIVLAALFVLTIVGASLSGWAEFSAEQRAHGERPQVFGEDGYLPTLAEQILQNWQSEWLALAVLVALSARLRHIGSKHSPDSEEEMRQRIESIAGRVHELEREASR
ncbi:MAG: DUF6766 family protein, partial [Chloroflexota bacterium]